MKNWLPIPQKFFLVSGTGTHVRQLVSFELALRDAGLEPFNFCPLTSIVPPQCELISPVEGIGLLKPHYGMVVPCVLSQDQTETPRQLISASIGVAVPKNRSHYGYLTEYHASGMNEEETKEVAEDMAATMLGSSLGILPEENIPWAERRTRYIQSGQFELLTSVSKTVHGFWDGTGLRKWSTVIAMAVFVF
jgi:arginine decarboxylase